MLEVSLFVCDKFCTRLKFLALYSTAFSMRHNLYHKLNFLQVDQESLLQMTVVLATSSVEYFHWLV